MSHDDGEGFEPGLDELHDDGLDRPVRAGFSSQSRLSRGGAPAAAAPATCCGHHRQSPVQAARPDGGRA